MRKLLSVIFAIVFVLGAVACVKMVVDNGSGSGSGGGSTTPDSSTVTEPCEVHTPGEWIVDEEPECEVEGKQHQICSACGRTIDTDIVPVLGHDYSEGRLVFQKSYKTTCNVHGINYKVCTRCGCDNQDPSKDTTGLDFGEWIVDEEPRCDVEGKKHFECTVCNESLMNDIIPALEHICAEEWTVETEATCTTAGERVKRCVRFGCGKILQSEEIPALGHVEVKDNAVAATCTTAGKTEGKHCSRCNTVLVAQTEIPITHTGLQHVNAKEPTCGEDGYEAFDVCITCGWSNQVTIPATGNHTIDESAGAIEEAATCTNSGTKIVSCKVCSFTGYVTIPALGHNFTGEWTIVKESTKTETGSKTNVCSRCNETITEEIPMLVTKTLAAGTYKLDEAICKIVTKNPPYLDISLNFSCGDLSFTCFSIDSGSISFSFDSGNGPMAYRDDELTPSFSTIVLTIDQIITEEEYNVLITSGLLVKQG